MTGQCRIFIFPLENNNASNEHAPEWQCGVVNGRAPETVSPV